MSRTSGLPWALACGFLFLLQLLLFWPGIASYDIVFVYAEWICHDVGDWHPPILIRLWSCLLALGLRGTGPLLLLQLALFWVGLGLLSAACARTGRRASALAVIVAAFLSPAAGWMVEVAKDSQMIAAMTAATGLAGWHRLQSRPLPPAAILAVSMLLFYALLLRSNAIFAVVPLAVALLPPRRKWLVGVLIAVGLVAPALSRPLFDARAAHAERSQQLFDMAGIAHHAGLQSIAGVSQAAWAETERQHCYSDFGWDSYSMRSGCAGIWSALRERPLTQDWLEAILDHPFAFWRHRIAHWNLSLRFLVPRGEPRGTVQEYSTPNPWQLGSGATTTSRMNYAMQTVLAATPLGWPFAWAALGCVLLSAAVAMPSSASRDLAIGLVTSGVTMAASLLLVSVAADQRYHAWSMAAIAVGATLLLDEPLPRQRLAIGGFAMLVLITAAAMARVLIAPDWPQGF